LEVRPHSVVVVREPGEPPPATTVDPLDDELALAEDEEEPFGLSTVTLRSVQLGSRSLSSLSLAALSFV
jgi:hypothetical protein